MKILNITHLVTGNFKILPLRKNNKIKNNKISKLKLKYSANPTLGTARSLYNCRIGKDSPAKVVLGSFYWIEAVQRA